MGIVETIMHDYFMSSFNGIYYISLSFFLIIFVYAYRNQLYVDEKNYLLEMIEHHSMALLTSQEMLDKNPRDKVKRLAEFIMNTQDREIKYMRQIMDEL